MKEKLAQFCHVPVRSCLFLSLIVMLFYLKSCLFTSLPFLFQLEYIFTLYDVPNIWHIPLLLKVPFSQLKLSLVNTLSYYRSLRLYSIEQDQKAHLAISKVLNLARYLSYLALSFVFLVCDSIGLGVIFVVSETVLLKNLLSWNGLLELNYATTYMCRWVSALNNSL